MNHLDRLKNLRLVELLTFERAIYRTPFEDLDPRDIECWHEPTIGPVLDADDIKKLGWTTADEYVRDDGSLSIIDCGPTGKHITIKPMIFQDKNGSVRIGWPFAGYVDPNKGMRWGRLRPPPIGPNSEYPVDQRPLVAKMTVQVETNLKPTVKEPPMSGPAHVSGTFAVHLCADEINDLIDDSEQSDSEIVAGRIVVSRSVSLKEVVELAVESVSPRFAELVQDADNAIVTPDSQDPGGYKVEFTYELDV